MLRTILVVLVVVISTAHAVDWSNGNWALRCDFNNLSNDLSNALTKGEECGTRCSQTSGCTHFTWTNHNGGTCWMKKGNVCKADAIDSSDTSSSCGIITESSCGGTTWQRADLTNYVSYPDPGSDECLYYNGCLWAGYFAFVNGQQPESWVQANNIIAIHSNDADKYKLKTFRLRQGTKEIDAKVYDMCADSDCNGCCTRNAANTGFLIDIEKYTMQRFGSGSGIVEWRCLDC